MLSRFACFLKEFEERREFGGGLGGTGGRAWGLSGEDGKWGWGRGPGVSGSRAGRAKTREVMSSVVAGVGGA